MMKNIILALFALMILGRVWGQKIPDYAVITEVKIKNDTIYVKGFEKQTEIFLESKKCIGGNFVYTNRVFKWFPTVSLLTVPFKIRPKTKEYEGNTFSDLKNVGVNVDFISLQWDRYFATGKTSTHRGSMGILVTPLVEELTEKNTKNEVVANKQFFASFGLSLNYSYNKLTFTAIPIGYDIATNSAGKQWIYDGKYWWGFGVGVDLKILEGVFK